MAAWPFRNIGMWCSGSTTAFDTVDTRFDPCHPGSRSRRSFGKAVCGFSVRSRSAYRACPIAPSARSVQHPQMRFALVRDPHAVRRHELREPVLCDQRPVLRGDGAGM